MLNSTVSCQSLTFLSQTKYTQVQVFCSDSFESLAHLRGGLAKVDLLELLESLQDLLQELL